MKDVVIVGYGPAGISAGIYLKRYGFDPIIIGKDNGALEDAHMIENLYGSENMSGHDLAVYGQNQAKKFGIELITDEVINIENMYEYYTVECKNHKFDTKVILLALGKSRNKFHLASKYEGVGVSYCATCDGFFYRKKRIGLVGNGLFMAHELDVLSKMSEDITVFTNGDKLEVELPSNVKVVEEKIVEFYGDGKLEGVKTKSTDTKLDGCFIALGSQSGFSLASHLGIELKNTDIVVDENFMTNVSGIYAAGDVIGGLLQVSKAISDGAMAATSISKYLKKKAWFFMEIYQYIFILLPFWFIIIGVIALNLYVHKKSWYLKGSKKLLYALFFIPAFVMAIAAIFVVNPSESPYTEVALALKIAEMIIPFVTSSVMMIIY